MKQILMFIGNVIVYLIGSFGNFMYILWFGKLPKLSIYHLFKGDHNFTVSEIFNDPHLMRDQYRREAIRDLYDKIIEDKRLSNIILNVRNDNGEVIGTQSLTGFLNNIVNELLTDKKKD